MRIFSLFFWTSIILLIFTGIVFVIYNVYIENNFLKDQVYKQLINIADSKSERVADFLENRKNDAKFLSESKDIKKIFDEKVIRDVGLVSSKIKKIGKDTAKDIEEYIMEHPEMNLDDLKESKEFNEIAVRPVGESGYTYVNSRFEGVLEFHPDPKARGKTYHAWKDIFPAIWKLNNDIATSTPCEDSFGFYDWKDIEGNLREKFTYHSCINGKTADGISFYVGASTYIDEYGETVQLTSNIDKELRSFQKLKGYSDLILINPGGDVIWTAEEHDELGTNLLTGSYNTSLLADMFRETKNNLEIGIGYPGGYSESGELNFFITAPIIDTNATNEENKFIGILALKLSSGKISDLITNDVGLREYGEIYIVNRDRDHITPLKTDIFEGTKQIHHAITSERIENCLRDYDNYYASLEGKRVDKISKFGDGLNYVGEEVLGAHSYILGYDWCIIAEMSKSNFEENANHINKILTIIVLSIFLIGILIVFILDSLYKIEKKDTKK